MTRVPLLTEVKLRGWGTDDERVVSCLAHENQPGWTRRANTIEQRAKDAGWPVLWIDDQRKAAVAAVRRLEGMDFSHRGQSRSSYRRRAAAAAHEHRRRTVDALVDDYETDDGLASMFDE